MSNKLLKSQTLLLVGGKVHIHNDFVYINGTRVTKSSVTTDKRGMAFCRSPLCKDKKIHVEYRYSDIEIDNTKEHNVMIKEYVLPAYLDSAGNPFGEKLDVVSYFKVVEGKLYLMRHEILHRSSEGLDEEWFQEGNRYDEIWNVMEYTYDFKSKKNEKQMYPVTEERFSSQYRFEGTFIPDLETDVKVTRYTYNYLDDGTYYNLFEHKTWPNYTLDFATSFEYFGDDELMATVNGASILDSGPKLDKYGNVIHKEELFQHPNFEKLQVIGTLENHTVRPTITYEKRRYEYAKTRDGHYVETRCDIFDNDDHLFCSRRTTYNYDGSKDTVTFGTSNCMDYERTQYRYDHEGDLVRVNIARGGKKGRKSSIPYKLYNYALDPKDVAAISYTVPDSTVVSE